MQNRQSTSIHHVFHHTGCEPCICIVLLMESHHLLIIWHHLDSGGEQILAQGRQDVALRTPQPPTQSGATLYMSLASYSSAQPNRHSNFSHGANPAILSWRASTHHLLNAHQHTQRHLFRVSQMAESLACQGWFISSPEQLPGWERGDFQYVSASANLICGSQQQAGYVHRLSPAGWWSWGVRDEIEELEYFHSDNHLFISHYYLSQQLFDCFRLIHSRGRGACNKNKASQIGFTLQMQSFLWGKTSAPTRFPSPPAQRHVIISPPPQWLRPSWRNLSSDRLLRLLFLVSLPSVSQMPSHTPPTSPFFITL